MKLSTITTDVDKCARCGDAHQAMQFKPFKDSVGYSSYTHFGMCPTNNEPVLLSTYQT